MIQELGNRCPAVVVRLGGTGLGIQVARDDELLSRGGLEAFHEGAGLEAGENFGELVGDFRELTAREDLDALAALGEVSREQLQRLADSWLDPDRHRVVVVH